jgi:hypothetical protein
MPSTEDILQYLTGAWRMMTGRPDGLRMLDISADGFWNSFFAMAVALPALIVGWVGIANELGQGPGEFGGRVSIVLRLALVDFAAWVVPLAALAAVASRAGISDRFVQIVVSTNWASALVIWLMLPAPLLRMVFPEASEAASLLSLALFAVSMVLTWRVTNIAVGKGAGVASAIFAGLFVVSLGVLFLLQAALGLVPPDQLPAG